MIRVLLVLVSIIIFNVHHYATKNPVLTWNMMMHLDYKTGNMPQGLARFHEQAVEVTGFIVPLELEGEIDKVKEFLLVPNPMACIHVPPPPLIS